MPAAAVGRGAAVDWVASMVTEPRARAAATPAARVFLRFIGILPPGLVGESPQNVISGTGGVRQRLARLWP
ncbi:hypothetical protein Shyd_71560 [Streptomyces hydrogenans]|uniref:Uncharacterized protein n=1 Tax=Streptomyces hydrogenans TaxID=1873719 RepID=A0ABQ3PKA8_9ACTN|nr:hypothetical protein Shyd_16970 [Streptomyces hydrogenans]GHI24366.1 hypothetical protein Shyd_57370 [Streptomyces hydrogenans]GHI24668.1 hypothetical protein Shyd_60390 [Streptomyces hydrogenans]GHI25447.1 hypothetical protein Shyd_68180 [Streptomyces hydrogenans]GHI25462.1 hypothetical protein Shyd_68330 [Streptomyces hydrogenans]